MTMYRQAPQIETALEAVDEVADVCMTLNGLESIALALSKDGMAEQNAITLLSCLTNYCALTSSAIRETFEKHIAFDSNTI